MAEKITKTGQYEVEVTPEPVALPPQRRKLRSLKADLAQARASKTAVQARHAEELAPIQATIDLLRARVDAAVLLIAEDPVDAVTP